MYKSIVEFQGNVTFNSNTVDSVGGALYLRLSSQIILHSNAHLEFIKNTGRQVSIMFQRCICIKYHIVENFDNGKVWWN